MPALFAYLRSFPEFEILSPGGGLKYALQKNDFVIEITSFEFHILLESLLRLRNKLIEEGRYTDAVDEMLVKLAG